MFRAILNFICHYRMQTPLMRVFMSFFNIKCINQIQRGTKIVVSLSAEENSFEKLESTLYSLFNQKILPDKIVLWISNEYELSDLPYSVTKFVKNGLDIRFVKDKGSYTKIIYALQEFKNCIIVTADENICYPKKWLSKLYLSYISNPQDIHVHSAAHITSMKSVLSDYKLFAGIERADYNYFPISSGGVLYPPNCFVREIFREDIYNKKANVSWEVWSWVIALISDRKIRIVKNHIKIFSCSDIILCFKKFIRLFNQKKHINEQINQLLEYYGNNIIRKLEKK